MRRRAPAPGRAGLLEPGESGYTIDAIFGRSAPNPLVMASGPGDNYLEVGGYSFGVVEPLSGVRTFDTGLGPISAERHVPHARNLLRPMHSEAFWILLLALAVVGVFGLGARLRLGPVHFGAQVGR